MNEAWTWRPLRDVTIRGSTWNPRTDPRSMIRYVDVSAISRNELRIISDAEHSAANAPSRARKVVKTGDTIFATVRPTLRRIAQVPARLDGEIVSTAFCVLRPNPSAIHPDFLYFAMQLECVTDGIAAMQTGASYPAVRDIDVLNQAVPLPPLSVQYGIATALNVVRSAVLCQKRSESAATSLKRSVMRTLFTHGLHGKAQKETEIGPIPESWAVVRVEEHAKTISKGSSPKWQGFDYVEDGILFIRSQNVGNGVMEWHDKAFLPTEWNKKEKRSVLRTGDLLINLVGASIGRLAVGGPEIEGANCNQAVCFVRLDETEVIPGFLNGFLLTSEGQAQIHGNKKDIARANLSLQDVRSLLIPKPAIDEQREIVAILNAIDHKIDLHRRKRTVLEEMFKALLHKLMTGDMRLEDLNLSANCGRASSSED